MVQIIAWRQLALETELSAVKLVVYDTDEPTRKIKKKNKTKQIKTKDEMTPIGLAGSAAGQYSSVLLLSW